MKKSPIAVVTCILTICHILIGCGSSVKLTNAWTDPAYSGPTKSNMLVVGLAFRQEVRRRFEYKLVQEFESRGIGALASIDGMPHSVQLDKKTFFEYFSDSNVDAVMITGLVRADTSRGYGPGTSHSLPITFYDTFHGYYVAVYEGQRVPEYWATDVEFVVESNLWDVASEKLIWQGISRAVHPEKIMETIEEASTVLVNRLVEDGLISPKGVR